MEPTTAMPIVPEGRPINILIVDDSAMMRLMLKRVTGLAGVPIGTIYEAANGQEAIAVLERYEIDALFTDINMPVMTGVELLKAISKQERYHNLLRVIISTDGSAARREEVSDLQVKMYVEKPFRPEVMRDVLCELAAGTATR